MSTFKKCPKEIGELANELLCEFTEHKLILDARVKIDFVFAYADVDDKGFKRGVAIRHHGIPALGLCRRVGLKDRVKGLGAAGKKLCRWVSGKVSE